MYVVSQDKKVIVNVGNNCTAVYAYDNEVRVTRIKDIYIKSGTNDFDYKLAVYSTNGYAESIIYKIDELIAKGEMIYELP